jgi:xanthosine utilization system XapX-like protein
VNSIPEIRAGRVLAVTGALALGLWADVHTDIIGQLAIGLAVWGLLLWLLAPLPRAARTVFFACVAIATAGELFLSLGWGLYVYRLHNVPLFVPPGHALMLLLGIALSRRLPEVGANAILALAGAYAAAAWTVGWDTLAVPLFLVIAVAALSLPSHRRLFASTFVLCLSLELYGTALGNWSWLHDVPWVGLVTTNPPALAGAFYCALDALVVAWLALRVVGERRAVAVATT